MKIQATVSYPVMVEIDVPDDLDVETIQEKLKDEADNIFYVSSISPVITECSDERCLD